MLQGLLAIALASAGLAVFGYLGSLLWQAAVDPLAGVIERRGLARSEAIAARGDALLRDGRTKEALEAFARAVVVAPVKSSAMAAAVDKHHTALVSRFIAASDRRPGDNVGLLSLALADRVLRQRRALQSSYVATLQTGNRKRRRDLEGQLRANSRDLCKAIGDLATEVGRGDRQTSVH
jgi:hypothetical protein